MTASLRGLSFAEVRLDALLDPTEALHGLFAGRRRVIATCRPGKLDTAARVDVLRRAIDQGARCIDVELEVPRRIRSELLGHARPHGVEIIISSHCDLTPSAARLRRLHDRCFEAGADIAKIACHVRTPHDNATLLSLLASGRRLVVVGMGAKGLPARLLAPLLGGEFTYAAPEGARPNAQGQLSFSATLQAMQVLRRTLGG